MSLGEADAKFPGQQSSALPPSPSRENPGQVYPKSDPNAAPLQSGTGGTAPAQTLEKPYLLDGPLSRLEHALADVIQTIDRAGSAADGALLAKFKAWERELTGIRAGRSSVRTVERSEPSRLTTQEGGMFTD